LIDQSTLIIEFYTFRMVQTEIVDPTTPNYFADSFPKDDFPRYEWTQRPTHLPAEVWTTETTHRDGQQGGLPLTTAQSLTIYDILCHFTAGSGAIRQAEFFVYRPSDRDALAGALERYHSGSLIEPTTWIRATAKDVSLIRSLGVRETGMLASASDFHTFHKFKPGGRKQVADVYLDAVRTTLDAAVRCANAAGSAAGSVTHQRLRGGGTHLFNSVAPEY